MRIEFRSIQKVGDLSTEETISLENSPDEMWSDESLNVWMITFSRALEMLYGPPPVEIRMANAGLVNYEQAEMFDKFGSGSHRDIGN